MSERRSQEIKSGHSSQNYVAGRDIRVHHGNVIQTIARSRIAQVAALFAILASIATSFNTWERSAPMYGCKIRNSHLDGRLSEEAVLSTVSIFGLRILGPIIFGT
jgi:hypothetical protein